MSIIQIADLEPASTVRAKLNEMIGQLNAVPGLNPNLVADSIVIVKQASDLAGTLDSTKDYFIDGIIDMGNQSIEVPAGGLNLTGSTFDVSRLISSAAGYTMFTSPVGGSGNLLGRDVAFEVTGAGSQVFDIVSATEFDAFEFARVNFNNCTSLGTIDNYRQGLETGTGRFGGTPNMTLKGAWSGGYFIDTSIVRSLDAGMTGALYQAGEEFAMASRFRSNQNIDLPANAAFIDFAPSNFTNPATLQLEGCIITRDGVTDANDANLTPNISAGALESSWTGNIGLPNTFPGGTVTVSSETVTTFSAANVFIPIAGTYTTSDLQHFAEELDASSPPEFVGVKHLGISPREYILGGEITLTSAGGADIVIQIRVMAHRDSDNSEEHIRTFTRKVHDFFGPDDGVDFILQSSVILNQNDYVYLEIANATNTNSVTAELDSFYVVRAR